MFYRKTGFLKRLFIVLSIMYLYIGIWVMLFLAIIFTYVTVTEPYLHGKDYLVAPMAWSTVIIPYALFYMYRKIQATKSNKIVNYIKSSGLININPCHEYREKNTGGYLGIDTSSGIFLFVRPIKGNYVDVVGINRSMVRRLENDGFCIKVLTYSFELPEIIFNALNRAKLYDTLSVLLLREYPQNDFPGDIAILAKEYAKSNNLIVPTY